LGAGVFAELILELDKPTKRNEMQGAESRNQKLGLRNGTSSGYQSQVKRDRVGAESGRQYHLRSFHFNCGDEYGVDWPATSSEQKMTVNLKPDLPELIAG
jgi:hypothetical protein